MEAPFSPNQKVVVVKTLDPLKKGDIYTVGECFQCPKCKTWHVGLKEYPTSLGIYRCVEGSCSGVLRFNTLHYKGAAARFFAPSQNSVNGSNTLPCLKHFVKQR